MSSSNEDSQTPSQETPSCSNSQEECGNKEEISSTNGRQQSESLPQEAAQVGGNSEHATEERREESLKDKLDSGSGDDKEGDSSDTYSEEVGQNESAQQTEQEVPKDNIKMDVDGANSVENSSFNRNEVLGEDQPTQTEPVHKEISVEDSGDVKTAMDSREEQEEKNVSQLENERDASLQDETKNQDSQEDMESINDVEKTTASALPVQSSAEVNQKETKSPNLVEETPNVAPNMASQSSTSMDSQASSSTADKRQERMRKLHELRLRKNEARKLNHVEVVEETKRNKRPANWEARKRKIEWEEAEEEARKQAELEGEDYEKVKQMETSALELERMEKRKMRKKNPDHGFSDFAQAQHRQYERLTKQMEPDMAAYEKTKMEMGESFYPGVNTIIHGHKPSEAAIDKMVDDLDKQAEKRAKFSRRRGINEDADVDYINDRNMRFNKKAARFYDQYTLETKQNLERGTAV